MPDTIVKFPLVSASLSKGANDLTKVSYYVDDVLIMDLEVDPSFVPTNGPVPVWVLVQLLVTPHHHAALLEELLARRDEDRSSAGWLDFLTRVRTLLSAPDSAPQTNP